MKTTLFGVLLAVLAGQVCADNPLLPRDGQLFGKFAAYTSNNFRNGPQLYGGGSIGSAQQDDTCHDPFFEGSCDSEDFAWKAFAGVRANPMFGAEIAYQQLGSTEVMGQTSGGQSANLQNSFTGTSVTGLAYLPVVPRVEAFAKAGALFWERDTQKSLAGQRENSGDKGSSALVGTGAQYRLDQNLHLRGEWEHMFNLGADSAYETDADLYSLGLLYSTL